tara:strand:+ start:4089 stop:6077 length:1989 start_codon:yes stop_codon:yes gene_type:complete
MPVDEAIVDGDTGFVGVNSRLDPSQLQQGFVASAINKRFVNGVAETRAGIKKMPWSNVQADPYDDTTGYTTGDYVLYSGKQINGSTVSNVTVSNNTSTDGSVVIGSTTGPASNTSRGPYFKAVQGVAAGLNPLDSSNQVQSGWNPHTFKIFPYGTVYGAGVFRDPSGKEYLIVASSSGTYATRHGSHTLKLTCPTISADVTFVQCFNVVVMLRGEESRPLVMKNIEDGFVSIVQEATDTDIDENESDGTEPIPNSDHGLFFGNRLLVPHSRDMVAVSDYLNYTRYAPIMSSFRVQQGTDGNITGIQRVNTTTLAVFKSNSIYMVSNIYGNLSDAILDEVTRDFGAISFKSTIPVGNDVWFLSSKRGVCSLSVAANGKVTAVQQPISEPIQPLVDRINWNYAHRAVAATYNNRYYLACPIDGSEKCNAILVFDMLQKSWSGYDSGSAVDVKEFVQMEYEGKRRLFFLSNDGYINLYDDDLTMCGFVDEVGATDGDITLEQVSDEVVTRGYTANNITQKKWRGAEVHITTNDPKFTVKTIYDGPEENGVELVTNKTFSRTKYDKPFDKPAYSQNNTNNDFFTKYREDYSVKLTGETGGADIILPTDNTDKGFDPDLHQSSTNKYKFRGSGRYIQLKVANTQGRLELNTVKVGALTGENLIRKEV